MNKFRDENDNNIDKDMDSILAILHDIPQEAIPDEFEGRLHEALKEEGRKIKEGRRNPQSKKRKWYMKAVAVAACFAVVFASVSVYNNNKGDILQSRGFNDSAVNESACDGSALEPESIEPNDYDAVKREKQRPENNVVMDVKSSLDSGPEKYGADVSCVDDGEKERKYIALIGDRLYGYEYELLSCEQDEASGDYRIIVYISFDPSGEYTDRQLVFVGKLGEIHEEQRNESQINSD